jgi:hypothetical protein
VTPAAGSIFAPAAGGNGGSARAAHFSGTLSAAASVWGGFGADFLALQTKVRSSAAFAIRLPRSRLTRSSLS